MSNTSKGVLVNAERERAEFDVLPRAVKAVFWNAPHHFTCRDAFKEMKAGDGADVLKARYIGLIAEKSAQLTRKTYGKGHPCEERLAAIAARTLKVRPLA